MANRRFEMYQYRQVLNRMRLGESSRAIARSGRVMLVGRAIIKRCGKRERATLPFP